MYKYLYVWYNPNKDIYYYKLLNHLHPDYYIGYINQYNHRLVLQDKIVIEKSNYFSIYNLKKRDMRNIIRFLEKNI